MYPPQCLCTGNNLILFFAFLALNRIKGIIIKILCYWLKCGAVHMGLLPNYNWKINRPINYRFYP